MSLNEHIAEQFASPRKVDGHIVVTAQDARFAVEAKSIMGSRAYCLACRRQA